MIVRLVSVSPDEYSILFPNPSTVFASAHFNCLNAEKVEKLLFIVGFDSSNHPEMGIAIGLRDGIWRAPFSAPMAPLTWQKNISLASVHAFFNLLKERLAPIPIRITLPPYFIEDSMLAKISGAILNMASDITADFNYHYQLSLFPDFEKHLNRAARKNYRQALKANFSFEKTDLARAYAIIAANRSSKGYYLAMSLDNLISTATCINIDSFILTLDNNDVAAAIVYHITPDIAHVVYWGDAPGFELKRPMNILPYHIFKHYHQLGFKIVNIGTSSTDGIPNIGLCNFKESLGCTTSTIISATI